MLWKGGCGSDYTSYFLLLLVSKVQLLQNHLFVPRSSSRRTFAFTRAYVQICLRTFRPTLKKSEMLAMLTKICPGHGSQIDWRQFRLVVAHLLADQHTGQASLFSLFDVNRQGRITLQDLQELCASLEINLNYADLCKMVSEIGKEYPVGINEQEFNALQAKLTLSHWIAPIEMCLLMLPTTAKLICFCSFWKQNAFLNSLNLLDMLWHLPTSQWECIPCICLQTLFIWMHSKFAIFFGCRLCFLDSLQVTMCSWLV